MRELTRDDVPGWSARPLWGEKCRNKYRHMVYTHDQKMTEEEFSNYIERLNRRHPFQLYKPNSKYGIFKPWQIRANDYYPIGILREDRKEELIEYLKRNPQVALKKMDLMLRNSEHLRLDEITYELKRKFQLTKHTR